MRVFGIFFVLFLAGIWTYTSWFYYTCSIKGFCETQIGNVPEDFEESENSEVSSIENNTITEENKVSAEDVLSQTGTGENENTQASGSILLNESNLNESQGISGLCENPIQGGISLGGKNNSEDVEKLETFLNEYEGENLRINGVYETEDYDAVKRFQEKYRSSILTPAGIRNPTGVVYTGTIKIITGIACGKEYPVNQNAPTEQNIIKDVQESSYSQTGSENQSVSNQEEESATGNINSEETGLLQEEKNNSENLEIINPRQ